MRVYDLIRKKQQGKELSSEEITFLLNGYVAGEIPDYQMSALLMAIYFRGMSPAETARLTMAMVHTGETLDLSAIRGRKVDKHSTGGVGDKTSLVLIPLVAAAGAPVAKMSGRGLGHTGGTIDKLEAIPGFRTTLTPGEFIDQVNRIGCAIIGQTANLVPADKKLYALRDVTATVESIPLIAASVMSKKIAGGSDGIVLDVKTGSGAFMKTLDDARVLARTMVAIGSHVGRRTVGVISDMDQPLGFAVGNALEVREAIATLRGKGPADLLRLCVGLGSEMLVLAQVAPTPTAARTLLSQTLSSGKALAKFQELIAAQGGNPRVVDRPDLLPVAPHPVKVLALNGGIVGAIDGEAIGLAAMALGAGRATKDDQIDPTVGVVLRHKVNDRVTAGEPLAEIYASNSGRAELATRQIQGAYQIHQTPPQSRPLIAEVVRQ